METNKKVYNKPVFNFIPYSKKVILEIAEFTKSEHFNNNYNNAVNSALKITHLANRQGFSQLLFNFHTSPRVNM